LVAHANLTGADLHEPKGADTASANTVYVADGSGSGTWKKISDQEINSTEVLNVNKTSTLATFKDISTAGSLMIPISFASTLTGITAVLSGTLTGADCTLNVYKKGGLLIGTFVITYTGSAKGDTYQLTPTTNNTFVATDYIEIASDGASTGAQDLSILLDFTYT
jgi:hypothetical protein